MLCCLLINWQNALLCRGSKWCLVVRVGTSCLLVMGDIEVSCVLYGLVGELCVCAESLMGLVFSSKSLEAGVMVLLWQKYAFAMGCARNCKLFRLLIVLIGFLTIC